MKALLCRGVPAGDGVALATDVYLPDGPGPFPTILIRTPYHRTGHAPSDAPGNATARFLERGYAVVAQDCRGKYDSEGQFTPLVDEARDGQAAIAWVAEQKWCNGRVATWGRSYPGIVQVPAASGGHEALRCIVPSVAPAHFFRDWLRYDGCFALGNAIRWSLTHVTCRNQPPLGHFTWQDLWKLPTAGAIEERVGFTAATLARWASHDRYDELWRSIDQTLMHEKVRVPGFHTGGWFDHLSRGTFDAYGNIRDKGATDAARKGQRLLIGPWGHNNTGNTGPEHTHYGNWEFGPEADLPVLAHELQFLDYHMKDEDNGFSAQPPVKVFLMGENRWLSLPDWPPEAEVQEWYLDSGGSANGRIGDGKLRREIASASAADTYLYDPDNPVPTYGGAIYWGYEHTGPVDQRPLLDRPDILLYRGPVLESPLVVIGDVSLHLFVASEAVDTDFIAKLCVQEPSGAITVIANGSLRCRYRHSWSDPQPLVPGEVTKIELHLGQTAYRFPAGSRICLTVTSSDFPRINPHPNTLAAPLSGERAVKARNSVAHGPGVPSCLRLPVVEL